jgi:Glycosyl hydrolase family 12
MFRALRIAVPVIAATTALVLGASQALAAVWSSSALYASWSNGGFTLYNNVWGSGPGPQTIWANSYQNWGIYSDQPNTGGVKSYPEVTKTFGQSVSSFSSITSSFSDSLPSAGNFESAYDIWADNYADEIMLWTYTQNVGPLGSYQTTVSIGGSSWSVYRGTNGSNAVFSFVRNGNETSGSVDIKGTFNWLSSAGWLTNATLSAVDFGWEISSTNNTTEDFTVNNYSLSSP